MTGRTPEEERLEAERITAENYARKEKLEAERWKAEFDLKKEELEQKKRDNDRQARSSRWQFYGTIGAALIGLIGTLIGVFHRVGEKADPSVTNFWGTVYEGAVSSYKVVNSGYSVADAFPKAAPPATPSPKPAVVQPTIPSTSPVAVAPPSPEPVAPVADGTCSGLDEQLWAIIPGPVSSYLQPNGAKGYTVRLNLKNRTQQAMSIARSGGELSDDQNHSLGLANGSLSSGGGRPFTVVDPGVVLPATFDFQGNGNDGGTVTFTINVVTSVPNKPLANNVIGCTALQVHQTAK